MAGQVHHLRGIKERFGRHTSAQDAKPAHFVSAFDHDRFQTLGNRRARSRIAAAAPSDDGKVVIEVRMNYAHSKKMREESRNWQAFVRDQDSFGLCFRDVPARYTDFWSW